MKPTARKPHRDYAGYRCECRNHFSGGHTVILDCTLASQQGVPLVEDHKLEGGRYQVLCDVHSTINHCTSMLAARQCMKDATLFCQSCRDASGEGNQP